MSAHGQGVQFNESVREHSSDRYNRYHCDKTDMDITMKELSEHVAKKIMVYDLIHIPAAILMMIWTFCTMARNKIINRKSS